MGPFAKFRQAFGIGSAQFTIANPTANDVTLSHISLDPLSRAADGLAATASLGVGPETPTAVPAFGHVALEIGGVIPATPGRYITAARVSGNGGTAVSIPVAIEVSAHPLWGLASMLLGLLLLGLVTVLGGQGEVKSRLHDALQQRSDVHAFLDRHPAPLARAPDVVAMDQDFELGLTALSAGVPLSVVDHRIQDAADDFKKAGAIETSLRSDLAGQPMGKVSVDLLDRDIAALQATFAQINAALGPVPATAPNGLAGRLDAFLLRYRTRFLTSPIEWTKAEALTDRNRAQLALTAGDGDAAQAMAEATDRWLRRSSATINQALVGYRSALAMGGAMLVADAAIRARLARGDLPEADRAQVIAHLDRAAASLAGDDVWLQQWRDAHHEINLAKTELTRVRAKNTIARFRAAIAAAGKATDYSDVDRLVGALSAHADHSVAAKRAGLMQVVDLWRAHVGTVTDPVRRAALTERLDGMAMIVSRGELKSFAPAYKAFLDAWNAWNAQLVAAAQDVAAHPACVEYADEIERDTSAMEALLRERPPSSETLAWEGRLDALRLDLQRHRPDNDTVSRACIAPLLDIGTRSDVLSGEIFGAGVVDAPIPAATRLRLARASGVAAAISATERAENTPREITVSAVTAPDDRVVGAPVVFRVAHLDPVWGAGARLGIDWGDGTAALMTTVEAIRQGQLLEHRYTSPSSVRVRAIVAEHFGSGSLRPLDAELGEGKTPLLIAPSPITRARALADVFLNGRFFLALAIATIVYFWRYQSRANVFGSRTFDYVELFALGFVANAAVSNLPEALVRLLP